MTGVQTCALPIYYPASQAGALTLARYSDFPQRQKKAREQGRHIGIGIGNYVEGTGLGPFEGVTVRVLDYLTPAVYGGAIAVLTVLLFIGRGAGTAQSTKSWIYIGGVSIGQPSELAKIAVVVMLAKVLSRRGEAPGSLVELWRPVGIVALPWLLVMAQPDLGTGLVFIGILFAMLFWAGTSWQLLLLAASPVISLVLAFSTGLWGAWFILLLALVAPRCCGCEQPLSRPSLGPVCARCWESVRLIQTPLPLPASSLLDAAWAAAEFEGPFRHILHAFKYQGRRSLARPIGALMRGAAKPSTTSLNGFSTGFRPKISQQRIPTPTHFTCAKISSVQRKRTSSRCSGW